MRLIKNDLTFYELIETLKKNKRFLGARREEASYYGEGRALLIENEQLCTTYIDYNDDGKFLDVPRSVVFLECEDLEAKDWQVWEWE